MSSSTRAKGGKGGRRSSDQETLGYDPNLFVDKTRYELYNENFLKRTISFGRKVDYESLSYFNLRSLFDAIAWTPMTELEFSVYPTLIKMFYANMEIGTGRKVIHSYVKGRKIEITKERINEIIGITNEGVNVYKFGSWPKMEGFDKFLATRRLLGYDVANAIKLNCNQFPLRIRLLHAIVSHIILPRKGHFDLVNYMDIFLLDSLLVGRKVNLGFIVLNQMMESFDIENMSLYYGMLMTKIFKAFNVTLDDETNVERLTNYNIINQATVGRLGYKLDQNGTWVPKKPQKRQIEQEIMDTYGKDDGPELRIGEDDSAKHKLTLHERIDKLENRLEDLFDIHQQFTRQIDSQYDHLQTQVNQRLDSMVDTQIRIEDRQLDMEARQFEFFERQKAFFKDFSRRFPPS